MEAPRIPLYTIQLLKLIRSHPEILYLLIEKSIRGLLYEIVREIYKNLFQF